MFDESRIDDLAALLAEAAKAEIMPRFRRLEAQDIRQKSSPADLVTEADVLAERMITARLLEAWPQAIVVGEEAVSADPSRLDGLADAPLAFVLDPVDGTFNFASGMPLFAVMLAVVVRGETVAGIIHDPVGGDWLIGAKGGGSFVRATDSSRNRVRVAEAVPVPEMTGAMSWQFLPEPQRTRMAANQARIRATVGYRCAAHEYRLVACGHAHFALYSKLMPWDHLAGVLIHAEAGGYSARFDGSAYRAGMVDGGLLAAPDRESWQALHAAMVATLG